MKSTTNILLLVFIIYFNQHIKFSVSRKIENLETRNFVIFRKNTINNLNPKSCNCTQMVSCSCCELVKIFYTSQEKQLCFNMIYQRNGLNFDLSLDSLVIKTMTVTNYKPFHWCSTVPGLRFTTICVHILELNQYQRSITVCPQIEVMSKKEHWQITYSCSSLSTQLPIPPSMPTQMVATVQTTKTSTVDPITITTPTMAQTITTPANQKLPMPQTMPQMESSKPSVNLAEEKPGSSAMGQTTLEGTKVQFTNFQQMPGISSATTMGQLPSTSQIMQIPTKLPVPQTSDVSTMGQMPGFPVMTQMTNTMSLLQNSTKGQMPGFISMKPVSEVTSMTQIPGSMTMGQMPSSMTVGQIPGSMFMGSMPGVSSMESMPGVTSMGSMPGVSSMGSMPGVSSMGSMPGVSSMGSMLGVTSMGSMPAVTSMGLIPGVTPMGLMSGMMTMGQMPANTSIGQLPGTIVMNQIPGTTTIGQMPGTTTMGQIPGTPTIGQMPGSATMGQISGTASIGQMSGMATTGQMLGPALIDQIPGIATMNQVPSTVTISQLPGIIVNGQSHGISTNGQRPGVSSIGQIPNTGKLPSISSVGQIVPGNAAVVQVSGTAMMGQMPEVSVIKQIPGAVSIHSKLNGSLEQVKLPNTQISDSVTLKHIIEKIFGISGIDQIIEAASQRKMSNSSVTAEAPTATSKMASTSTTEKTTTTLKVNQTFNNSKNVQMSDVTKPTNIETAEPLLFTSATKPTPSGMKTNSRPITILLPVIKTIKNSCKNKTNITRIHQETTNTNLSKITTERTNKISSADYSEYKNNRTSSEISKEPDLINITTPAVITKISTMNGTSVDKLNRLLNKLMSKPNILNSSSSNTQKVIDHLNRILNIKDNQHFIVSDGIETSTTKNRVNFRILKRQRRNHDIFDILHQSNRCERAYKICITKSKNVVISRISNTRNLFNNNMCFNKPAKIVVGIPENICTMGNLKDEIKVTTPSMVTTSITMTSSSIHSDRVQTDNPLGAIIIHDDSLESSDFHPQNNFHVNPVVFQRPDIFPLRTPPLIALEMKEEALRNTANLNDTLIFKNS